MPIINVNPTRMALKDLKSRYAVATRGHKLLKDKFDELVRRYTTLVKSCVRARKNAQEAFLALLQDFNYAKGYMSDKETLQEFLLPSGEIDCTFDTKSIMNIDAPEIDVTNILGQSFPYSYASTNIMFDDVVDRMRSVVKSLINLSEIEKTCQRLSSEIERTKRRVNSLEYILIPNLQETIRYVSMKIDENDRAFSTRLLKSNAFKEKR